MDDHGKPTGCEDWAMSGSGFRWPDWEEILLLHYY